MKDRLRFRVMSPQIRFSPKQCLGKGCGGRTVEDVVLLYHEWDVL